MKTDKEEIKNIKRRVTAIEKFIEKDGLSKNGRLINCDGISKKTKKPCEYSWITKSKMDLVSCPKCGKKIKVNK